MSYQAVAEAVSRRLGEPEIPSWQWVQRLESGPPEPLANPVWLRRLLEVLGLEWPAVIEVLGIGHEPKENEP